MYLYHLCHDESNPSFILFKNQTDMKKTILFLLTAIGFLFLPSSKVMAQATVGHDQYVADLNGITYITCDGTEITLQGTETFDLHFVINKNKATFIQHITSDATGTDAAGNTYKALESVVIKEQTTAVNGSFTVNAIQHLVSQGSAPNFTVHTQFKVTVAPDGTTTVVKDRVFTSCD